MKQKYLLVIVLILIAVSSLIAQKENSPKPCEQIKIVLYYF